MAPLLDWDDATKAREIDAYRQRAEAEDRAEQQPDDAAAEQVRLEATELEPLRPLGTTEDGKGAADA